MEKVEQLSKPSTVVTVLDITGEPNVEKKDKKPEDTDEIVRVSVTGSSDEGLYSISTAFRRTATSHPRSLEKEKNDMTTAPSDRTIVSNTDQFLRRLPPDSELSPTVLFLKDEIVKYKNEMEAKPDDPFMYMYRGIIEGNKWKIQNLCGLSSIQPNVRLLRAVPAHKAERFEEARDLGKPDSPPLPCVEETDCFLDRIAAARVCYPDRSDSELFDIITAQEEALEKKPFDALPLLAPASDTPACELPEALPCVKTESGSEKTASRQQKRKRKSAKKRRAKKSATGAAFDLGKKHMTANMISSQCVICLDRAKGSVLDKCMHVVMCTDCCAILQARNGEGIIVCPICRQKNRGFLKCYLC